MHMDDQDHMTEGRTGYDWIHGMRIGMIVGAVIGLLLGWSLEGFPVVWLIIGGAAGVSWAPRWVLAGDGTIYSHRVVGKAATSTSCRLADAVPWSLDTPTRGASSVCCEGD